MARTISVRHAPFFWGQNIFKFNSRLRSFPFLLLFLILENGCASGHYQEQPFLDGDTNLDQGSVHPIDRQAAQESLIDQSSFSDLSQDSGLGDSAIDQTTVDDILATQDILLDINGDHEFNPDIAVDGPLVPDTSTTPNIGDVCQNSSHCYGGTSCQISIGNGTSLCTQSCTPDNIETPGNEDTCPNPSQNMCGRIGIGTSYQYFCFRRCTPYAGSTTCAAQVACDPYSTSISQSTKITLCSRAACQNNTDCPVLTSRSCNPTTGVGCDSSKGESCYKLSSGLGRCALSGNCNIKNGLCEGHTRGSAGATIGSPCEADTHCGNGMFCLQEQSIGGQVFWRQGYCSLFGCLSSGTLPSLSCPSGSTCNRSYVSLGGLCQKTCTLNQATTCRSVNGDKLADYECYSWNHYILEGAAVTSAPVCDLPISCDLLSGGCEGLGLSPNSTGMDCRNSASGQPLTDKEDPSGLCMDTTTSSYSSSGALAVILSEVMVNPNALSDEAGEWIELYNTGLTTVSLYLWQITDNAQTHIISVPNLSILPGQYLVLTRSSQVSFSPAYVYGTDISLSNTSDFIELRDNAGNFVDRIDYTSSAWPMGDGSSMSLKRPFMDNSYSTNWCKESTTFGSGPLLDKGTPGSPPSCY